MCFSGMNITNPAVKGDVSLSFYVYAYNTVVQEYSYMEHPFLRSA